VAHRAGVLGRPIGHSLSPVIHTAGYAAAGLTDWCYTARECAEADLAGLVAGLGPEWVGLSLTMPLKRVALAVADEVSAPAAAIGAANTLIRGGGGWRAENTDAPGMVDALRAAGVRGGASMAILGAGGTARAALAAARELCATSVTVYTRRASSFEELVPVAAALGVRVVGADWVRAAGTSGLGDADVVVSTVPKGAGDEVAGSTRWRPRGVLLDVVYDPWPTALAVAAQAAGCRVVSGLDLLVAQAARQFVLFTGVEAPVAAMRAAVSHHDR
jgi:shikimate dehydrogenase